MSTCLLLACGCVCVSAGSHRSQWHQDSYSCSYCEELQVVVDGGNQW